MGPLKGLPVLEFAGIGPGPFCAMVLADLGAEVIRLERKGAPAPAPEDFVLRGRRSIALDLKSPAAIDAALRLVSTADALIEGFRPGVMERLGLGPDACLARNPRLAYGRMTGWGQDGPLAQSAGHDIDYIALTGALHAIGRPGERPVPPLNLVGDYGGGGMLLALGLLAAMLEAKGSGRGCWPSAGANMSSPRSSPASRSRNRRRPWTQPVSATQPSCAISSHTPGPSSSRRTETSRAPPTSRGPSALAAPPVRGRPGEPSPRAVARVAVEPAAARRRARGAAASGVQAAPVISRSRPATISSASGWAHAASLHASGGGAAASTITCNRGDSSRS